MKIFCAKIIQSSVGVAMLAGSVVAGNVLINPGFEADAPGQNQNLAGWTWYGQPWGNTLNETGPDARSGSNYFKVFQGFTGTINYSGIYQDYFCTAGSVFNADGWAKILPSDLVNGANAAWLEVSFRDTAAKTLALYRSGGINTNTLATGGFAKDVWVRLAITNQCDPENYTVTGATDKLVAPAGTEFVRYQVVFQGDAAGSTGAVFFDDLNLDQNSAGPVAAGDWQLVWSDEFQQPDGSAPAAANWGFETGGNGWGNDELEFYTARTNNVRIEGGQLVIEARQENFSGRNFTSARLLTKGKHAWTYGRVEARIKIPRGQGIWPAFWMLGTNLATAGWPLCGEVDIMENIGREPGLIHGTVHGPGYSGAGGIGGPAALPSGAAFADDFHVYAVECAADRIRWLVDERVYFSLTPDRLPPGKSWVFNQPKFILLNLAVGGAWPGNPDSTTVFPQRMVVDYVRVLEKKTGGQR